MTSDKKERGTIPRKVRGFRDIDPRTSELRWRVVDAATRVYRAYGFEHWDTPLLEYADALGKYLPDQDTAEEGVYSFRNPEAEPVLDTEGKEIRDDMNRVLMENHILALRYDLTAPLARRYAEQLWHDRQQGQARSANRPPLFRRYQFGPVYRFEAKLDPGRYREFWQLDFDTVGAMDPSCDAEVACILCDALQAMGLERSTFEIRVNTRKLHQGLFERLDLAGDPARGRDILRVVDKVDKIGLQGVEAELGAGRRDETSGAFNPGLKLPAGSIDTILSYVGSCVGVTGRAPVLDRLQAQVGDTPSGREGLAELQSIHSTLSALGYGEEVVVFDPSVARGLAYYTGPVFEAWSKLEYRDEKGQVRRFGAICGGGRYDGLVERLLQVRVPATGASIGVDRLAELLSRAFPDTRAVGPVLLTVMEPGRMAEYAAMATELRQAGIPAEVYYGMDRRMKAQFSYADARGCPVALVAGSNEFDKGTVSLKDLRLGRLLSATVGDRQQWRGATPAQVEVSRSEMVARVREMVEREILHPAG